MRGDEARAPAVEREMRLPFEHVDIVVRKFERAAHVRERERIRLAADLDEQAADHRQRERQLQHEAHARARFVEDPHRAAHAAHLSLIHI